MLRYCHLHCCSGFWTRRDDVMGIKMKAGTTANRERESGERTKGQQCSYDRDSKEWEEVENIFF